MDAGQRNFPVAGGYDAAQISEDPPNRRAARCPRVSGMMQYEHGCEQPVCTRSVKAIAPRDAGFDGCAAAAFSSPNRRAVSRFCCPLPASPAVSCAGPQQRNPLQLLVVADDGDVLGASDSTCSRSLSRSIRLRRCALGLTRVQADGLSSAPIGTRRHRTRVDDHEVRVPQASTPTPAARNCSATVNEFAWLTRQPNVISVRSSRNLEISVIEDFRLKIDRYRFAISN